MEQVLAHFDIIIQFALLHGDSVIAFLTAIVAAASVVANWTDTESDNKAVAFLSKIVNLLAINFFKFKKAKIEDSSDKEGA